MPRVIQGAPQDGLKDEANYVPASQATGVQMLLFRGHRMLLAERAGVSAIAASIVDARDELSQVVYPGVFSKLDQPFLHFEQKRDHLGPVLSSKENVKPNLVTIYIMLPSKAHTLPMSAAAM